MRTTPRTALLLAAALLLPASASAGRKSRVRAEIDVEPLRPVVAVVTPAGTRCRVVARGTRPFDAVAPFEIAVEPGPAELDCLLPSGRVHHAYLDVHPAQRVTVRLAERGRGRPRCPPGGCSVAPLSPPEFSGLHTAMARERHADDRLELLERTAETAWFTVAQTARLLDLFPRSADRVEVIELIAPHLVDRQNGYHLLDRFPPRDRDRVRWLLEGWGPDDRRTRR